MDQYREYLKDAIVVQKTVVSYRLLSRALKVHVNQAKEMLFDFYTSENAIKPKSVHATYIVIGYRKPQPLTDTKGKGRADDDNDTVMFDSSFPGTQTTVNAEEKRKELIKVVELCQEEELDTVKEELEQVLSVHLYSLEQVRLEDFTILTGCSAKVLETHQNQDPLGVRATYGIILNPCAKRTGNQAHPLSSEPRKTTMSVGQEKKKDSLGQKGIVVKREAGAKKKEIKSETKDESETKERKPATKAATLPATKTAPPATAKPKRGQSNDIFSSWKAAPKKKDADPVSEPNSAAQSPKMEEEPTNEVTSSIDDDDDKESNNEKSQSPIHDDTEYARKRKEKDEELRNMMDDDDDDEDIKMEDQEPPAKIAKVENQPEPEVSTGSVAGVTTRGGRVRGRRKVAKKVQSQDSDGYLVTKIESVWESFSEDEPEQLKSKPIAKPVAKGKKNKDSQSKGQGNLMSYFAKK